MNTHIFHDFTYDLPDECLSIIFQSLQPSDRNSCSLVCRRWLTVEGQSRHRLTLNAQSHLFFSISSLFNRFDSVTKLSLKCDRRSPSIGDDSLFLISQRCVNLTRLKLRSCKEITDDGIEAFSRSCSSSFKKLSVGSCSFGPKGLNSVLENCWALEELSVKRLRGITTDGLLNPIGPGRANGLKVVCLKELYNGQCFGPLIVGSRSLRALKLFRCSGDWDRILRQVCSSSELVEIHLERVQVSDVGLSAISKCCLKLEVLHLVKTPECSNFGLVGVAENCKLLRKLHIDGWKANKIGDDGLIAVAKNCPNLLELVLIGINPTNSSLEMLANNCKNLERLALCGSETVGDAELSCIASKCIALKKLCIKNCPVSDHGMEALACGCPSLVKVKVKKCRAVTCEGADWLRASRVALAVNLDCGKEPQDPSVDDGVADTGETHTDGHVGGQTWRSVSSRARFSLFTGRNFVSSSLRRWSSSNSRNYQT